MIGRGAHLNARTKLGIVLDKDAFLDVLGRATQDGGGGSF